MMVCHITNMYMFSQSKVPNYQRVFDNVDRDEVLLYHYNIYCIATY